MADVSDGDSNLHARLGDLGGGCGAEVQLEAISKMFFGSMSLLVTRFPAATLNQTPIFVIASSFDPCFT